MAEILMVIPGPVRTSARRTVGLITVIKAGTTTITTQRRRCCLGGSLRTQRCVTTLGPADVSSSTPLVPLRLHLHLFLDRSITSLTNPKTYPLVHQNTQDLLSPPVKLPAPGWSTSQRRDRDWYGSMGDNIMIYPRSTQESQGT